MQFMKWLVIQIMPTAHKVRGISLYSGSREENYPSPSFTITRHFQSEDRQGPKAFPGITADHALVIKHSLCQGRPVAH